MRKPTKYEIVFSIILLILGLSLMFTEYKEWANPIIFGVLTFQQIKNYVFFRKSNVQESKKRAKTSFYCTLIIGSSTLFMIVLNLTSLLS
ncbi:hypothetical protein ACFCYN_07375 [Gottfriedia sp. NPDC056225]|uniref:hypothetical protein n=1 Tax=Gottfriedia sp. NPDC056225 TaxID=3345751 RepID=UPI0015593C45|nr:hypothetical protein HPK19_09155 [Arthrobacter citreus]